MPSNQTIVWRRNFSNWLIDSTLFVTVFTMNWASLSRSSAPMPMASAPVASAPAPRVGQVIIDGLVVLKIIKHSQESYESVAGGLLGLNRGDKLEITYRYAGRSNRTANAHRLCSMLPLLEPSNTV
jgi:hypothetical protein